MEIYIEKDVLDRLNLDFLNENLSLGQIKLRDILQSYSELEFCTNLLFDDYEFQNYKFKNPLFNKIVENAIIKSFDSFNHFITNNSFRQTIVVELKEDFKNKESVENKGGLYFTYDNYQEKIEEIITHFDRKIDLSEKFIGWPKVLNKNILKLNEIIINDNYLIDNVNNIDNNIKPLINSVKKQCKLDRIIFFTDYLNKINYQRDQKETQIKDLFKTIVKIYHNSFDSFSNHDRILYSNFLMIDCPIGFNQLNKISNSMIIIGTIFDKFTYNRRRRHFNKWEDYL